MDVLNVTVDAADGRPGCLKGEKQRKWVVKGRQSLASYYDLIVDYRPRGGQEQWLLRWDGEGLTTAEGVKWTKLNATAAAAVVARDAAYDAKMAAEKEKDSKS